MPSEVFLAASVWGWQAGVGAPRAGGPRLSPIYAHSWVSLLKRALEEGRVSLPCALCTLLAPTHVFFFSAGNKKLTNKATLWYVPLSLKNVDKVLEVPPVVVRRPSHCSADEVAASTSTRGCWVPAGSATGWVRGSRWGPSVRVLFTLWSQVQAGLGLWALPISAPEYVLEPLSCWPPCPSLLCLFVCLFVWLPHSIWCPQARDQIQAATVT